eukprot:12896711-Prorocentrum_lima.AAC.1
MGQFYADFMVSTAFRTSHGRAQKLVQLPPASVLSRVVPPKWDMQITTEETNRFVSNAAVRAQLE